MGVTKEGVARADLWISVWSYTKQEMLYLDYTWASFLVILWTISLFSCPCWLQETDFKMGSFVCSLVGLVEVGRSCGGLQAP